MSQHDYDIANQSFPAFRTDLNNVLGAINSSNSGTSRPSGAVEGTIWLDTTSATTPTLKFYDGADDISLATIDYSANTVNWLDSTVVFDIVGDTTPQLGGNLDVNGNSIVSVSNGNITFTPDGTGKVIIDGLSHPTADGSNGQALVTDGSGNLSFAAAGLSGWSEDGANNNLLPASASAGIYLGTTSATASNLLDDYEEGTWTPSFANAASATFGTNGQQGYYTKVGRLVTVGFNLSISGLGGGSGGADIIGLPFAASNTPTASYYAGTIGGDDNWSTNLSGNNTILQIYGNYLNTRIFLQKNNCSNIAAIQLADIGISRVFGTITYFTDA